MGLMDILNGMQNGPRGQRQPGSATPGSSSGMSPIMMALLGLLAFKAVKHVGSQPAAPGRPSSGPPTGHGGQDRPTSAPSSGTVRASTPGGGLADIFGSLFGGGPGSTRPVGGNTAPSGLGPLLGGAAVGTMLSGGLG